MSLLEFGARADAYQGDPGRKSLQSGRMRKLHNMNSCVYEKESESHLTG